MKSKSNSGGKKFLGQFSVLSAVILLVADLGAALGYVVDATVVLAILGVAWVLFVSLTAGFLIFLNEWYSSKDVVGSFIVGLISTFLIGIPIPLLGVVVSLGVLLSQDR